MGERYRIEKNPFYVLGLRPDASNVQIEREGNKLLSMLELKLEAASRYQSPQGELERRPEDVRTAIAELRDPDRRLLHELWFETQPQTSSAQSRSDSASPAPPANGPAPTVPARKRRNLFATFGVPGPRPESQEG